MLPQNLTLLVAFSVVIFVGFSATILFCAQSVKMNADRNLTILNQILSITDEYEHQLNLHNDLSFYLLMPNQTILDMFNFEKDQYVEDIKINEQVDLSFSPPMISLVAESNTLLNETLTTFNSSVLQKYNLNSDWVFRRSALLFKMRILVFDFVAVTSGSIHVINTKISSTTLQIILIQIASLVVVVLLALLSVLALREKRRQFLEAYELSIEQKIAIESSSNVKNEFMNVMSHELRTPLNGVLGMLELLLDSETQNDRRNYLSVAVWSAECLLLIVTNILEFRSLSTSLTLPKRDPVSLFSLAAELFKLFEPVMQQKSLHFELVMFPLEQLPHHVLTDIYWLRQILVNLLSNAHKFTVADGYVLICFSILDESEVPDTQSSQEVPRNPRSTSNGSPSGSGLVSTSSSWSCVSGLASSLARAIHKAAQKDAHTAARNAASKALSYNPSTSPKAPPVSDVGDVVIEFGVMHHLDVRPLVAAVKLRIEIIDTGVGISPASLQELFEVFGMADQTLGREFGGVGLGLAIAFKLTKRLNGSLSVRSEVGVGSTFTLDIPLDVCLDNPIDPASLTGFNDSGPDGQLAIVQQVFFPVIAQTVPITIAQKPNVSPTPLRTSALATGVASVTRRLSVRNVTFDPKSILLSSSANVPVEDAVESRTVAPAVEYSPQVSTSPETCIPRPHSRMRLSALGLDEQYLNIPAILPSSSPHISDHLPKAVAATCVVPDKFTPRVTTTAPSSGTNSLRKLTLQPALSRPCSLGARPISISVSPPGATREESSANAVEIVLTPPPKHQRRSSLLATSSRSSFSTPHSIVAYSSPQAPLCAEPLLVDVSVPGTSIVNNDINNQATELQPQVMFVSSHRRYSSNASHLCISVDTNHDISPETSPSAIPMYRPATHASITPLMPPPLHNNLSSLKAEVFHTPIITPPQASVTSQVSGTSSSRQNLGPNGVLRMRSFRGDSFIPPHIPQAHLIEPRESDLGLLSERILRVPAVIVPEARTFFPVALPLNESTSAILHKNLVPSFEPQPREFVGNNVRLNKSSFSTETITSSILIKPVDDVASPMVKLAVVQTVSSPTPIKPVDDVVSPMVKLAVMQIVSLPTPIKPVEDVVSPMAKLAVMQTVSLPTPIKPVDDVVSPMVKLAVMQTVSLPTPIKPVEDVVSPMAKLAVLQTVSLPTSIKPVDDVVSPMVKLAVMQTVSLPASIKPINDVVSPMLKHFVVKTITSPIPPELVNDGISPMLKPGVKVTATGSSPRPAIRPAVSQSSADCELSGVKRPLHVLLVEDNNVNQRFALAILAKLGHTAELAENGLLGVNLWCRSVGLDAVSLSDSVVLESSALLSPVSDAVSIPQTAAITSTAPARRTPHNLSGANVPIPRLVGTDRMVSVVRPSVTVTLSSSAAADVGTPTTVFGQIRRFDMCLMDISMPVMDGVTAATVIRRLEQQHGWNATCNTSGPFLPIIAVTANTESAFRDKCMTCGMQDYICKPFKKADLMEKMNAQS